MQTINLNQNSFRLFPTIYMVQNDTGRELKMILDDVTLAGTETGAVAIKRSDGSYYTITATIDATNNAFDADMTQALTQPSRTECQLKVTASDDTVISTYTFIIMVQPSTDGLSEEQLGINPQDLIDAAAQLTLSDNDVKLALLQIAEKVVYIDEHGQDYYDALEDALYPPIRATSVTLDKNSLVFSGIGGTDTLVATVSPNNVEDDTVYWGSSDKDVAVVSDGVVIATGIGNCTITAICNTKNASASVSVASATLLSISAVYTQSGTVYDTTPLDDLKDDLVVTAYWDDNTQSIVPSADYTLSGSLSVGTSTVTVTYSTKTTTFNVTVSDIIPSGYTRVQYLTCTPTAVSTQTYINTGIAFNNPTTAKMIVEFEEESGSTYNQYQYPIGTRKTNTGNTNDVGWGIRLATDHTTVTSWSNAPGASVTITASSKHTITATWQSGLLTIQDGSNTPVTNSQTVRGCSGYPICLFGLKYATQASGGTPYPFRGNIYYAKAVADGVTLFEVYPCVRDQDSKPGFYDITNNAFYAPYGNYITAGPEV